MFVADFTTETLRTTETTGNISVNPAFIISCQPPTPVDSQFDQWFSVFQWFPGNEAPLQLRNPGSMVRWPFSDEFHLLFRSISIAQ
jgi:hypothetical protein